MSNLQDLLERVTNRLQDALDELAKFDGNEKTYAHGFYRGMAYALRDVVQPLRALDAAPHPHEESAQSQPGCAASPATPHAEPSGEGE
jgi:hypothetical protein